jgi:hypothetical protein
MSETGRPYSKYYIPRRKEPLCRTFNELLDAMQAQLKKLERDAKNRRIPKRIRAHINRQYDQLAKKLSGEAEKISLGLEVLLEAAAEGDIHIIFKRAKDGYEISVDRMRWQTNDGFVQLRDATRGDLPNGVYLVETTDRERWLNTRPWDRADRRRVDHGDIEPLVGASERETSPKPSAARPEASAQPAPEQTAKSIKTSSAGGEAPAKKEQLRRAMTADLDRCIEALAGTRDDGKTNRDAVRKEGPSWLRELGILASAKELEFRLKEDIHRDRRRPPYVRKDHRPRPPK